MSTVVDISPSSLAALADVMVAKLKGRLPVVSRLPLEGQQPPALTPQQAIAYSGRCKTAVFEFMRDHPGSCVVGDDGIRRVRTEWVDAWILGNGMLRELDTAHRQTMAEERGRRS